MMLYLPYHLLVLYSSEAEHFLTVYVYADLPTLPPTRTLKHLVSTSLLRSSAILGLLLVYLTTKWSSIPKNLSTSWPSMMTYLPTLPPTTLICWSSIPKTFSTPYPSADLPYLLLLYIKSIVAGCNFVRQKPVFQPCCQRLLFTKQFSSVFVSSRIDVSNSGCLL